MPITKLLEENAKKYGDDIALVEINPQQPEDRRITWKEYELIEPTPFVHFAERSHGVCLMRKRTVLRICS